MELLVFLLLLPGILAQQINFRDSKPNDEPFLPIFPIYPYSPKLIKRGTDQREGITQLKPELYAPSFDAPDPYTASYSSNYPRDPYYPSYNPYPKSPSTTTPFTPYQSPSPFSYSAGQLSPYAPYSTPYSSPPYSSAPYSSSPYSATPFSSAPYSSSPYIPSPYAPSPNFYQSPYPYPNYYNQPYPPAVHPNPDPPRSQNLENSSDEPPPGNKQEKPKKSAPKDYSSASSNQFVDGTNHISTSPKDSVEQATVYNSPSQYNQLDQDVYSRNISPLTLPKTTYRVISVAGQPVGPDYPLPATYAKIQQLEQAMSQTLAKLLAQHTGRGTANVSYRPNPTGSAGKYSAGAKSYDPSAPAVGIAKTKLAYASIQDPPLQRINEGPSYFGTNLQSTLHGIAQNAGGQTLMQAKFPEAPYIPKTVTRVTMEESQSSYIPPARINVNNHTSGSTLQQDPNYEISSAANYDQSPIAVSYRNQNLGMARSLVQPPDYRFSGYHPMHLTQQQEPEQQAREVRRLKTNSEDANFGTKQSHKG